MVKLLLDHNAKIDTRTVYGKTALHSVAKYGHTAIVQVLLDHKANIEARTVYGETALH